MRFVLGVALGLWLLSAPVLLVWWERPVAGPSDELAHVGLFAALTMTALAVVKSHRRPRREFALATVCLGGLALGTELAQALLVTGRSGSMKDLLLNLGGIAIGAASFSFVSSAAGQRAASTLAMVSVVAFLGALSLIISITVSESRWWRCLGSGSAPVADARWSVVPGPSVEFDGTSETWISSSGVVDGRHVDGDIAQSAVCSAMESRAFTAVAVFRVPPMPVESVAIFGSYSHDEGAAPNFEIAIEGRSPVVQLRSGRGDRAPRTPLPGTLASNELTIVAMKHDGEEFSAFLDGRRVAWGAAGVDLTTWHVGAQFAVGPDPGDVSPLVVEYATFFGAAVADADIVAMDPWSIARDPLDR